MNPNETAPSRLVVLWTNGDKDVAEKMALLYTLNSKLRGWWPEVTLIVWGPSTKLLSESKDLQAYLAKIIEAGVNVEACKVCTDMYGISAQLEALGVDVRLMGQPLTEYLKDGNCRVITV
ncbi:DsrE family protein [Heliobacterium undosum]|uniref:DsrE family protein n=1 Tax=Heliomicrobium undosum TaxID=121734 RepID=A0A845LD46_9FIRM|nr:DsrE family protein [Heliomicrobium undosum]MZP30841.1 DsrE family protein [Heliomicrobium undosum]